jgi:DNA helicase-2/ATP-dependent DNA helicase PcrA
MVTGRLSEAQFFQCVDEVLEAAGRRRLEEANRRILSVRPDDRVLQILAGPGSGKTEMLVWRVLYELFVLGTPANRVLVTTFTRKAATELSVRVVERSDALIERAKARGIVVVDPRVHDLRVGTIHSLCDSLLAEFDANYMAAGSEVIDEVETTVRVARELRRSLTRDANGNVSRVFDQISQCEHLVSLFRAPWEDDQGWPARTLDFVRLMLDVTAQHTETWIPRCSSSGMHNGVEALHGHKGLTDALIELQKRWERYLDAHQILDFTTIQKRFVERQECVLAHLDHVLVDEFQDTNPIQFELHTGWLRNPRARLTVVGDDDQAMYRFRGSDIECFSGLEPFCTARGINVRQEKLEKNWRSTSSIVRFTQDFKRASVLGRLSMPKTVGPGDDAVDGEPPRILRGGWNDLCACVASEIAARDEAAAKSGEVESTAILLFSTSERVSRSYVGAAYELRAALEEKNLRVYNPRNKTATHQDSPVAELFGLISYLIDPVSKAKAGKGGRLVEVWGSHSNADYAQHARTAPPPFRITQDHSALQKRFMKAGGGGVGNPEPGRRDLVDYVDDIRGRLVRAGQGKDPPRLTLAGFVSRILSFPRFRRVGFTEKLFRQALFTSLLEANIAPTRRTMRSLDRALSVEVENGKFVWPDEYWSFLNIFGSLLMESMDDPEVEAFAENAVAVMTFHQAKGLEFDHVYVAATGRDPAVHPVLRTMLFSGKTPHYRVDAGQPSSKEHHVLELAAADRERELYVALTRAKKTLTILHDPDDQRPFMALHPVLDELAGRATARLYASESKVKVLELKHA